MQIKKTISACLRVLFTNFRFLFGKLAHGSNFLYSPLTCLSLSDSIALSRGSFISFGSRTRTRGRCRFSVQERGRLILGKNLFLNSGCQLNCRKRIAIGSNCEFGPNVLVYDHDHDFRDTQGLQSDKFNYGDVSIGDNCWIGAGAIILRGTSIGNNCVVAAGSVVKGVFPDNSIIVQKRDTSIILTG